MFLGRWGCTIDKKWRLTIPAKLNGQFNTLVLLLEDNNGCIQIYNRVLLIDKPSSTFKCKVRVGKQRMRSKQGGYYCTKRITIPQEFRDSSSFWYGRKVTLSSQLASQGSYLELWPYKG